MTELDVNKCLKGVTFPVCSYVESNKAILDYTVYLQKDRLEYSGDHHVGGDEVAGVALHTESCHADRSE